MNDKKIKILVSEIEDSVKIININIKKRFK